MKIDRLMKTITFSFGYIFKKLIILKLKVGILSISILLMAVVVPKIYVLVSIYEAG